MCFFNRVKSPQSLEFSPLPDLARLNSVCNVLAFTESLVVSLSYVPFLVWCHLHLVVSLRSLGLLLAVQCTLSFQHHPSIEDSVGRIVASVWTFYHRKSKNHKEGFSISLLAYPLKILGTCRMQ